MPNTKNLTNEILMIAKTLSIPCSMERYKVAVQIQRNKILQEGLDNIYDILYDIRYNKHHWE